MNLKLEYAKRLDIAELDNYLIHKKGNYKLSTEIKQGDYFYIFLADRHLYYCTHIYKKNIYYCKVNADDELLVNTADKYNYYWNDIDEKPKNTEPGGVLNKKNEAMCAVANNHFIRRVAK
jgi:hypothetical protein